MESVNLTYLIIILFLISSIIVFKAFVFQISKRQTSTSKPKLSLIIAAKNEEKNINSLFDSLEQLNYPNENFEVIIIDDCSTDRTAEIIQSRLSNFKNFTLIRADNKELKGKKGALKIGIENSKHNFIVITDADCKPESDWLKSIAGGLDDGYDFVFGVAPILKGSTVIEKLSAFENLRNTFLTIAAVGLNIPYSAAARSFGMRKTSFEKVGGYANTTQTLSGDDDLLLREAVKNKMLIGTVTKQGAFVYSAPPKTLNEYFLQKKRHLQTSFHYLLKQKIFLGFWHLINLTALISILLSIFSPILVLPFLIKLGFDLFIVLKHQKDLGHNFKFYEIIYLQILFEIFIVVNYFNSLSGNTKWK